jgi:hypothetical protein
MTIKAFVMYLAIAGGLAACTTTIPDPSDDQQQPELTTVAVPAELSLPPTTNAQACSGDVFCPPEYTCEPIGDFDCGEEFCRVPGAQCNAQLSTFIRVQHVFRCSDSNGNVCISLRQGRRLVHCGC